MTTMEAEWSSVKHLILGDDPPARVYSDVVFWLKKIESFRKGENQRMFLQDPVPEDLAVHKVLLQRLIADGDHLLLVMDQIGLPENVEGITQESVAATLALLRADYRGWHEPMSSEQRAQILKEAFPDVP